MIRNAFFIYLVFTTTLFSQREDQSLNVLTDASQELTVSKQWVYSSRSENIGILEVLKDSVLFEFTTNQFVNSGAFKPYNWIKMDVENKSSQSDFIFEFNQTYIDSLSLYLVKDGQVLKTFPKKGLHFEQNNTPSFLSNKYAYIYPISLPSNKKISIYINGVVNDGSFRVVNKIWTPVKYEGRRRDIGIRSTYFIFFAGFTSLVVVLSLALFFFSKQNIYLYYSGFVTIIVLNLMAVRYFFSPLYLEKYVLFGNNFNEMLGYLQLFWVLLYVNHLLGLKQNYVKIYRAMRVVAFGNLGLFVLLLFLRRYEWFYAFSYYFSKIELIAVTLFTYGVAVYLMRKKNSMAFYFAIAYFPLVFFIVHYILTAMKLTTSYNPLQWEFVIFFEIAVLSLAMAHQYYLMLKENKAYHMRIYSQRLRISRDLHDNIGAHLTFIISSVDNLKFLIQNSDKQIEKRLSDISSFASSTIAQLRDTIWAMNKKIITYEDFQSRVLAFIEKAKLSQPALKFNFSSSGHHSVRFSSVNGITIFRVLQESISNALKYSKASQVDIFVKNTSQFFEIEISDNGVGFDMSHVELGNGLENMQKRMEEVGGECKIHSKIGEGTIIKISMPKNTINSV